MEPFHFCLLVLVVDAKQGSEFAYLVVFVFAWSELRFLHREGGMLSRVLFLYRWALARRDLLCLPWLHGLTILFLLVIGAQMKPRCQANSQIIIRPCGTNMLIYISMLILYKAQSQSAFENSCTASLVDRQLCMACFFLRSKVVVNVNPGNCRATHASFGTFQSTS